MPDASCEAGVSVQVPFAHKGEVTKISWRPRDLTTAATGVRTATIVMPNQCIAIHSWMQGDTGRYANTFRPSFVICPPSLDLLLREQAVYWPMQQKSPLAAWEDYSVTPGVVAGVSVIQLLQSQYIRDSTADGMVVVRGLHSVENSGPFGQGFTVMLNIAPMFEQCTRYVFTLQYIRLRLECPGRILMEVQRQ
jgi:hypothetical protein